MRLRLGCHITHEFVQPTPLIALLRVHDQHAAQFERLDVLTTSPVVPLDFYRDSFGNACCRMVATPGVFSIN